MKKLLLSVSLCLFINNIFAQSFMQGAGLSLFIGGASNVETHVATGITYSPRINFYEKENLSLSFGVPLSIGFSGGYSYQNTNGYTTESNTLAFMFNAPLIINLNLGSGATKESKKRFGFFAGGGYGFYHGGFTQDNVYVNNPYGGNGGYYGSTTTSITDNYTINGPVENIGMRFGVGRKYRNIETKFSIMQGLNEFKPNIFGIGALFNF